MAALADHLGLNKKQVRVSIFYVIFFRVFFGVFFSLSLFSEISRLIVDEFKLGF